MCMPSKLLVFKAALSNTDFSQRETRSRSGLPAWLRAFSEALPGLPFTLTHCPQPPPFHWHRLPQHLSEQESHSSCTETSTLNDTSYNYMPQLKYFWARQRYMVRLLAPLGQLPGIISVILVILLSVGLARADGFIDLLQRAAASYAWGP